MDSRRQARVGAASRAGSVWLPCLVVLWAACGASTLPDPDGRKEPDPLQLAGVTPAEWTTAGGVPLELRGQGFAPGTTVRIGGQPASAVSVLSAERLTALLPAAPGHIGPVEVRVIAPDGGAVARTDLFSYTASDFRLATPWYLSLGDLPTELARADLNRDGALDLVVSLPGSDRVELLLNDGSGGFHKAPALALPDPRSLVVVDVSGIYAARRSPHKDLPEHVRSRVFGIPPRTVPSDSGASGTGQQPDGAGALQSCLSNERKRVG